MNAEEIVRVSSIVIDWLDNPFSVSKNHPFCQWCDLPLRDRKSRCEVCGLHGARTGPIEKKIPDVFVETYKPRRVIKIRRKRNADASRYGAAA